jgi:hypothetical protein
MHFIYTVMSSPLKYKLYEKIIMPTIDGNKSLKFNLNCFSKLNNDFDKILFDYQLV